MVAVLFVALSLPNFGPLLDLVGGSTIAATAVVFPAFFYIYLLYIDENLNGNSAMKMQSPPTFIEVVSATPKCRLCICFIIVAIGIVGGAATTFSAIRQLAATQFSPPCYLRPFLYDQQNVQNHVDNINCCGAFQNISISGNSSDCAPYFDYYNQH
ncbi:hypothetical protein AB6A40_008047 [Gnathostoma spinigerum]|uniref:Amino acid transporter transmembrane domain-containing protein n=1 Tax=Gnathostoma spinigerum TaxID=75299 RepID=A0ABD6EN10_9BILA